MRKRDLAARIEALESRPGFCPDPNQCGPHLLKTPGYWRDCQACCDAGVPAADLPPNGPTVQLPADSDALIDTTPDDVNAPCTECGHRWDTPNHVFGCSASYMTRTNAIQEQVNKTIENMEMARQGYSPRPYTATEPSKAEWLQSELDGLTEQLAAANGSRDDWKFQAEQMADQLREGRDERQKLRAELELTAENAVAAVNAHHNLKAELAAANEHIAAQDSEIATMRKERDRVCDELANRAIHSAALRNALDAGNAAHARTKELLGEARQERDELRDKVSNFKRAFE